jgi:hypothetical protein
VTVPLLCALGLAVVHVLADRLRISRLVPRSAWLSAASGASVAFVFLLLIPELVVRQAAIEEAGVLAFLDRHVWLAATLGLVAFYSVEHAVLATHDGGGASPQAFAAHMVVFALYNVAIGYLLFDPHPEVAPNVLLYALAMALHLFVIDESMRRHHPQRYHRVGRWVLAAAVLLGAGIGAVTELPTGALALPLALLAGGIVLNALKEELPEQREGRVWPFAAGAVLYTAVIMVATI